MQIDNHKQHLSNNHDKYQSIYKGYPIELTNGDWIYSDTKELVSSYTPESCGNCGMKFIQTESRQTDESDPCLGILPGVMNACCGHGESNKSYIQFSNGTIIRGFTEIKHKP